MKGYEGDRRVDRWQIKKEISIGDIVTIAAAILAIATAWFSLDKRLTIVELAQEKQMLVDRAQDSERLVVKSELRESLQSIESKVDWLIRSRLDAKWTK